MKRHLRTPLQKPLSPHTVEAFKHALPALENANGELLLDSGCGTGESTLSLAIRNPESLVVGVDKSQVRINRALDRSPLPKNVLFLRAELADFWRLLRESRLSLKHHFVLYPNPWPKAKHLKRRWHGHPIFPELLLLGATLELRTNWKIYADEFEIAAKVAGLSKEKIDNQEYKTETPLTLFEKKYLESGHQLYRLRLHLQEFSTQTANSLADRA
ncbi:MAG: hypothetical protein KDD64_05515 [Bdellovibrionales bacterium]|nr:hypothetical protein [Bdellovibrionales bacterium]